MDKISKIHLIPIWGSFIILSLLASSFLFSIFTSEIHVFMAEDNKETIDEFSFEPPSPESYIGFVRMKENGDLQFSIKEEKNIPEGFSSADFIVSTENPNYKYFLDHTAPFAKNEIKMVAPWN